MVGLGPEDPAADVAAAAIILGDCAYRAYQAYQAFQAAQAVAAAAQQAQMAQPPRERAKDRRERLRRERAQEQARRAGGEPDRPDDEGPPGDHERQNEQFRDIVRRLGLDDDQASRLHDEITKQGFGRRTVEEIAREMFPPSEPLPPPPPT